MTHLDPRPYGGQRITLGPRDDVPLHALAVDPHTVIQFPDAGALVCYARDNYDTRRAR
jgi:hypothetical protein